MARFYRTTLQMFGSYPRKLYPWIIFDPDAPSSGVIKEAITKRPTQVCFGDKDVKHRRMKADVTPEVSDPPSDLKFSDLSAGWNNTWNGYAYTVGLNDTWGYIFMAHADWYKYFYLRAYHWHLHPDGYLMVDYYQEDGVDEGMCNAILSGTYPIRGEPISSWGVISRDGGIWDSNIWYSCSRDVILKDIFPWFWLNHMEDVHKALPQNPGALSEIIRNTIADYTRLDSNNYANILDAADLIKDFATGKVFDLVSDTRELAQGIKDVFGASFWNASKKRKKNLLRSLGRDGASYLGNLWLKYRYEYKTTKMDIEDFISKTSRNAVTDAVTKDRVMRGSIQIPCGTLRIKMRIHPNPFAGFDRMLINADRRGLLPGLYNLWDMIPFSFIGDWFAPIGDYLNDIDQSLYFRYYKVDELLVSTKETVTIDQPWGRTEYLWYTRQLLDEFPQWEVYVDDSGPSGKAITYRLLDTLSLAVG